MVHLWAERESENALVGLAVQNLDLRTVRELGLKASMVGVVVIGVEADSPADRAGVQPGDVIHEINRDAVRSVKEYERVVSRLKKGEVVLILLHRRGGEFFFALKKWVLDMNNLSFVGKR